MNDHDWESLIGRHLDGVASPDDVAELSRQIETDPDTRLLYLKLARVHATLSAAEFDEPTEAESRILELLERHDSANRGRPRFHRLAAVSIAVVVLVTAAYFLRPHDEPQIVRITGLSGSLSWTGDGGRVVEDLGVGSELAGGTVEGRSPNSWIELAFLDGSTVMLSGAKSMLTFSDHGQKKLQLKEGTFSADVISQPQGRPMIVQTRTASLEVLGTQFNVDADLYSTTLNVSEGSVRVNRLSDEKKVIVVSGYRAVVVPGHNISLTPIPDSVFQWKSQLHLGESTQRRHLGRWSPRTDQKGAELGTVPYFIKESGKTIYAVGFGVSSGDRKPVVLQTDSKLRIRGRIESSHRVFFGITVRQANGDFAGKFQTIRPAGEFRGRQDFEVVLQINGFQLDPSLKCMQSKLPNDPFGLVVESFWCHSLYDPVGLAITEIELIPPD